MARLTPSRIALAAAMVCAAGPAAADPITLVATLAPIIGGTAAAFIVGNAAYIALAGYALYSNNSAKRKARAQAAAQRAQYNAGLQDRNVNVLSGEAPWQVVYGNPAPIGGSIVGIFTSGSRDQFKHLVIVYASHECAGIDEIYLDGEPVGALDGNGDCTTGAFFEQRSDTTTTESVLLDGSGNGTVSHTVGTLLWAGVSDENGSLQYAATASGTTISAPSAAGLTLLVNYSYSNSVARVNVQKHLSPGGVDTADAYLIARCPEWTATDKLSGYTYLVVTLDLDLARFQGGPPNITARLRGKPVYDWRTGLTAYSANAALCLGDFLTSEAGFGASTAQVESGTAIAAANACDAAGFRCDGVFNTSEARETTKQNLEDAFGGTAHQSGGVWRILAGAWTSPVMTISEADLAAPIQITQASYPSKERYNTVRGTYVDGDGLGVATDFTPWSNSAYVAIDGIARVRDVAFPFTRDHQRTQDLARMIVERSRGGLVVTIPGFLRLWPLQPGDRIAVNNAEYGFSGKTIRIADWDSHPNAPVTVSGVEDVAVYYNAAAVITADAAPNTNLPSPYTVEALTGLTAASGTEQLLVQSDGTILTRVLLGWSASTSAYVTTAGRVDIQYRPVAVDSSWTSAPSTGGDETRAYLLNLQDGVAYQFRSRFVNQLGIAGAWTSIVHIVVGKSAPPADVGSFTVQGATLQWSPVTDLDLAGYEVRFNYGSNAAWAIATPLHVGVITESPWTPQVTPPGQITLLIKAKDTSGNYSENAAVIYANLGDVILENLVLQYDDKAAGFPGSKINCAVSAGNLLANDSGGLFWGDDAASFWGTDSSVFWATITYLAMDYVTGYAVTSVEAGARLTLDLAVAAESYTVEYRYGTQGVFWDADDGGMFWGVDADAFWPPPTAWQTWPGEIVSVPAGQVDFRITTQAGELQGAVSTLTLLFDVEDETEEVNDVVISSAGTTRIPITKAYRSINNVQLTLQDSGGTATTVGWVDKNATLGPLVQARNSAGALVAGLIDARIQGVKG